MTWNGGRNGGLSSGVLHKAYLATHTIRRKGRLTPEVLEYRRVEWYMRILTLSPADREVGIADVEREGGLVFSSDLSTARALGVCLTRL